MYITKFRCNQNHSLPQLRKSIFGTFNYLVANMIAKLVKSIRKSFKDSLIFKFGNVLHRDKLRLCLIDEPRKLVKQQPSLVSPSCLLVVLRERLTWRTSGKKRHVPLSEIIAHLMCGYIRHRLVQELGMVIVFVCIFAAAIEINSHANIDTRLPQATGKPAAAEQIHGVDSVIPDLPSCRFSCHF